jgi:hypothetical protein
MPQNAAESLKLAGDDRGDAVELARLHMVEIANSARQPWVAYGDRYRRPSLSPLARHFRWSFSIGIASLSLGSVARTELGLYAPGRDPHTALPQLWSGQQLRLVAKVLGFTKRLNVLSLVEMDQLYTPFQRAEHQYYLLFSPPLWLKALVPGIGAVRARMNDGLKRFAPAPEQRPFWMSPYVFFAPQARGRPPIGPAASLGNFGQPDVLVGLSLPARDADAEGATTFRRRFSWDGRGAGKASVDFRQRAHEPAAIPGIPRNLQPLRPGLHAFAAAQAYYHRPGDWKEMPNFFNPLWGARLMPVLESNAAAKLALPAVPLLRELLLH